MLVIKNFKIANNKLFTDNYDFADNLVSIFKNKLDKIGISYKMKSVDNSIIFYEKEDKKLFISIKENHIPLSKTDKRYKESKPYLVTNKLTENQYLKTQQVILNTLLEMGIQCDIVMYDKIMVKDLTVVDTFPIPKSFPMEA